MPLPIGEVWEMDIDTESVHHVNRKAGISMMPISQEIPKIVANPSELGRGREQISQPWEEPNLPRPPAPDL